MVNSVASNKCCGCEACAQICPTHCIEMVEDEEGFLFPKVDLEKCVKCNCCEKVCPAINRTEQKKPIAGYAYRTTDEDLLKKTSSGGFFTAAAQKVLAKGGVVFGAAFNARNEVVHTYIESLDELDSLRRSKYVQSRIANSFSDCLRFLKSGREVLFCGTPCQVKALNLFLDRKYDNLVTIDFVCHGVPSPGVFKKYLIELCEKYHEKTSDLGDINFREKLLGFAYGFSFKAKRRKYVEDPRRNLYLKGFLADLFLRKSCHSCSAKNFVSGADYTICDFWGVEKILPTFPKHVIPGVSQVFVFNEKLRIFSSNDNSAIMSPFAFDDSRSMQKWLCNSVPMTTRRRKFFAQMDGLVSERILVCSKQTVINRLYLKTLSLMVLIARKVGVR